MNERQWSRVNRLAQFLKSNCVKISRLLISRSFLFTLFLCIVSGLILLLKEFFDISNKLAWGNTVDSLSSSDLYHLKYHRSRNLVPFTEKRVQIVRFAPFGLLQGSAYETIVTWTQIKVTHFKQWRLFQSFANRLLKLMLKLPIFRCEDKI